MEAVGRIHGPFLMTDDQQLGIGTELVDELEEPVQVDIVEGRLHLVHDVERRRPAAEHREQKSQRRERALPS